MPCLENSRGRAVNVNTTLGMRLSINNLLGKFHLALTSRWTQRMKYWLNSVRLIKLWSSEHLSDTTVKLVEKIKIIIKIMRFKMSDLRKSLIKAGRKGRATTPIRQSWAKKIKIIFNKYLLLIFSKRNFWEMMWEVSSGLEKRRKKKEKKNYPLIQQREEVH